MHVFVSVSGASGAIYARSFLQALRRFDPKGRISLCPTAMGRRVYVSELGEPIERQAGDGVELLDPDQLFVAVASGSRAPDAAVFVPCSAHSLAALRAGLQDHLPLRTAALMLKLRRPLLLAVREMPWSTIMLDHALELSRAGAVILPASPHFYHRPQTIAALTDSLTGYLLDLLGIAHDLEVRWHGEDD